jgi:outer membrane cobalamin receptor
LILVVAGFWADPTLSGAQETAPAEVTLVVTLVSEGGEILRAGRVRAEEVGDVPAARGKPQGIVAHDGTVTLRLARGATYNLVASAPGHRDRSIELSREQSGTLRVVLSIDPYQLPAIAATTPGGAVGASVRAIHQVRFDDESLTYSTVGEWLADLPGVSVRRYGPGGRQVLTVRGSRPEDVLVLLDGVPLNDPLTGRADLSGILTSTLESVTLVRGAASQRFGSGAAAGALLLTSRMGEGTGIGGGVRMESYGVRGVDVQADISEGGRRLGVTVAVARSENDFSYRNPVLPGSPVETRSNADISTLSAALHGASGPVQASLRVDRAERGVPGRIGTSLFETARADDRSWIVAAGVDEMRWRTSVSYGSHRLGYRASRSSEETVQTVADLRLSGDVRFDPGTPVTLGARLSHETVAGDAIQGRPGRTVVGGRVALALGTAGVRVDPSISLDVARGVSVFSPDLTVTWIASSATRIWTRAGQGFRLPTFGDLYFASQYRVRPNPELRPERVTLDAELGGSTSASTGALRVEASGAVWLRHTQDPIVWLASSVAVWSPQNLRELRSSGLELELGVAARRPRSVGWRAQLAGTLQRSRVGFGHNRNPLPYEPAGMGRLTLETWWGSTGGRLDIRYTGPRTTSIAATRSIDGYTTFDVSASHYLDARSMRLGLIARIENVLDQRYELIELYPEVGRRLVLRLEARRSRS